MWALDGSILSEVSLLSGSMNIMHKVAVHQLGGRTIPAHLVVPRSSAVLIRQSARVNKIKVKRK
jgi:hypothetical protein